MPQKTLRFKIYQDGRVEETAEGFTGTSCNDATRNLENAQLAAEQLLIRLKIDNESGVRSNCIWSLCRLYEKLNNTFQESFVDECTKIALFDKEPSVMEEAKTALDSMGMQGFYN